jgi:hypothetical protein
MEIPSIFISEDWRFAFYEGLNQLPDHVFRDKTVAELECGNGWISIALAEKWSPLKVFSLILWILYLVTIVTQMGPAAVRHFYYTSRSCSSEIFTQIS